MATLWSARATFIQSNSCYQRADDKRCASWSRDIHGPPLKQNGVFVYKLRSTRSSHAGDKLGTDVNLLTPALSHAPRYTQDLVIYEYINMNVERVQIIIYQVFVGNHTDISIIHRQRVSVALVTKAGPGRS